MKDFVYIQSNIDIMVTSGLQGEDVTNKDAHVPDRLKVNPLWPRLKCLIRRGQHLYPSEITTWNTVKRLQEDKVLTIGAFVDSTDDMTVIKEKKNVKEGSASIKKAISKKEVKLSEVEEGE